VTAFGLLLMTVGTGLLWQGFTGSSALDEVKAAIRGETLPKPLHKGGAKPEPIGGSTAKTVTGPPIPGFSGKTVQV
jgi:hypothetical protein